MELPKNLKDEIWEYCRLNNITNIDEFTLKLFKQGFSAEKYGSTPITKEKEVEKIVEKIVEVPVEKIVEKIVEKPIEKEVYITNDIEIKKLTDEITLLKDSVLNKDNLLNEYTLKINTLTEEVNNLKLELAKRKKDIYGE